MTAKILVVDDSITIQKIVAMAFENEDASVEGMGDGNEALTRLQSFHPDIVLADVDMPGLNGFELSREIKKSSELNSISVLLLASDFEDFDESLFRASLANGHITKPFKSEDLVRKVMQVLDSVLPPGSNEATEEVIELSSTDRVDENIVIDLGEDQLMDSPLEGLSSKEEEIDLALPRGHELMSLEVEQDAFVSGGEEEKAPFDPQPEEDLPVEAAATADNQAEGKLLDQDESLDELLMRVDDLSKKSEILSGNGSREELSRMEAIDQMLKEVNALKSEAFFVATKDEEDVAINFEETAESRLSKNPNGNEAVLAEINYTSEENAETLEAAFSEITNGNSYPAVAIEPPKYQESIFQENALVTENKNEDFIEKNGDSQLSQEGQLNQLMETEVRRILKQSLTSIIEQELSGLSEKIMRTVEENVQKITPGIAKAIIEKEIDQIKTMKDG